MAISKHLRAALDDLADRLDDALARSNGEVVLLRDLVMKKHLRVVQARTPKASESKVVSRLLSEFYHRHRERFDGKCVDYG